MVHVYIEVDECRLTSPNSFDGDVERDGNDILEPADTSQHETTSPLAA